MTVLSLQTHCNHSKVILKDIPTRWRGQRNHKCLKAELHGATVTGSLTRDTALNGEWKCEILPELGQRAPPISGLAIKAPLKEGCTSGYGQESGRERGL